MKNDLFIKISRIQGKTHLVNIDFEGYFSSEKYENNKKTHKIDETYKIELVNLFYNRVSKLIYDKIQKPSTKYSGQYYFYGINFKEALDVEIFAKALFMLLYYKKHPKQDKSEQVQRIDSAPLYIAVDFNEKDYAKEFVRIFSIFYVKSKESEYMENIQIAVCTNNNDTGLDEVNFILAGKDLASAYETANNFVYYNADASLEFIPLLKFLKGEIEEDKGNDKDDKRKSTETEPLFPFDLFLECDHNNGNQSWFLREMQHRLKTDLRKKEYGCKISDISVRVGSKIKIDKFYEAELLFQNAGTVKRFAYLLALDIVSSTLGSDRGEYLYLLAYENYSAVLIQEVKSLLIEYAKDKAGEWYSADNIHWLLDVRKHINLPTVSFERITESKLKEVINQLKNCKDVKINCVTVVPINTTMSTVYKLHSSFINGLERKCKDLYGSRDFYGKKIKDILYRKIDFANNYCLVAVGDGYSGKKLHKANKELNEVEENFICCLRNEININGFRTAVLKKDEFYGINSEVKFLLSVESEWSRIDTFNNNQPLLQVDKTSTLIDTYFQSHMPDDVIEYYLVREYNLESKKNEK